MARLQYVRQLVFKDKGIKTKLEYHPTMIDPSTADVGEDYESYNKRRFDGDEWTKQLRDQAKRCDLVKFENWATWPNTVNAHRAVKYFDTDDEIIDELIQRF